MDKRKLNKKGFTIVELVIVVAVIAILAAVLIPTFSSIVRKANVSADQQLVRNLNVALASEGVDGDDDIQAALDAAEEYGFNVGQINKAKASGSQILWNKETGKFEYSDNGSHAGGENVWQIASDVSTKYSTYLYGASKTKFETSMGIYVGDEYVEEINFVVHAGTTKTVDIRTEGDQCVLKINAPDATVNFYGFAKEVNVIAVADHSLNIYGAMYTLKVTKGNVVVQNTGVVFEIAEVADTGVTITNQGFVAEKAENVVFEEGSKEVSDVYEISTLAQLETFRDTVNAGNTFSGYTVKLMKDITLNDGWNPIGAGARKVADAKTQAKIVSLFAGTFDGNNKKISNLNNKGFVPADYRLVKDEGVDTYAYGFFGLVQGGAVIKNVTFDNVAIDTSAYTKAAGDSVAAVVGYAHDGALTIENVTVNGTVKAKDAVGGILGRSYTKGAVTIKNCTNNANVTIVDGASWSKAGGIAGFIGYTTNLVMSDNTNIGTIRSENTLGRTAALATVNGTTVANFSDYATVEGIVRIN